MPKSQPLVSVIVVTLNNLHLLKKCLNSLQQQDYGNFEIIVVDNGSDQKIEASISKEYPTVTLIRLEENQGFAAGNNRGFERARGEYLSLINNDATAHPGWISSMVETAESDPLIGAIASIVIDSNYPDVLDSCGVGIAYDGMSRQVMRGKPVPVLDSPQEVLLFSGCACLIRKSALAETGPFDEEFFAYCEDTDLGLRLRRAGWRIVVAPGAYVDHAYSMTGGKFSLQKIFWVERNHFWVVIKNFPWFMMPFVPFFTLWRYLLQAYSVLMGISDLKEVASNIDIFKISVVYVRVYIDIFRKLGLMIPKRYSLKLKNRIGQRHLFHLLRKYNMPTSEILGLDLSKKHRD